ncbi:MAG TPA: hypothetical protein VGD56_15305 [Gemmatirosa sp.]
MRRLLPALLALTPALAAAQAPAAAPHAADPDLQVAGGLHVPGWTAHFDHANASPTAVNFVPMGGGYHVTGGPAAIYFDSTKTASGAYTARVSITQMKAPMHPEAYGLFVGGQHLSSDAASYLYFLVRGDGKYLIKQRAGATDIRTLVDWTASPAIHSADAAGKATNAIRVQVGADSVRFFANDQAVAALPTAKTGPLAGVAGLRVNHNLDVHIDGFSVATGAAAR